MNTYTTSLQFARGVAADLLGNFVVVWHSDDQDGSNRGVFGQRYDNILTGTALGTEFQVNTYTTGNQTAPAVAASVPLLAAGDFVVVWTSLGQDGDRDGVFGQRLTLCGDGVLDIGEVCDDGNNDPGDGCDAACLVEVCFVCMGDPSLCSCDVGTPCLFGCPGMEGICSDAGGPCECVLP